MVAPGERENLNECVGVLRAYMYIMDSVGLVKAPQVHILLLREKKRLQIFYSLMDEKPVYSECMKTHSCCLPLWFKVESRTFTFSNRFMSSNDLPGKSNSV